MINRQEFSSLREGLVGCWVPSLGASGLSVIDRSGSGSSGTLVAPSSNTWTASGSGVALAFDGSTQYASLPFAATFGASATLSMWVKRDAATPPSPDGNTGFFYANAADGGQESHYPYSDGTCYFRLLRSARTTFTPLSTVNRAQWHNLTVVTDGTTYAVYQAGQLAHSTAAEATVSLASPLHCARASFSRAYFCAASFDDIRLYNRALRLSEIRLLASRRGIGLSPLPDRAAGLPRKLRVNVGGDWRPADAYVHNGTSFRLSDAKINVGGVWQ